MAYVQSILSPDPLYLQTKSYDAKADRKWFADILSPGVVGPGSYAVTWTTAMNISIAAGTANVLGQNIADQGMYRQYVSGATALTVTAAHATLPRIDTVIIRVLDNAADASTFNEARLEIVPGTATAAADLTNLTGKANLATLTDASKSVLVLSYILVPAAAVVLDAAKLKDVRTQSTVGSGTAAGSGLPIGSSLEYNGAASPPDGGTWLAEDGSAVSRTTYSTWFARVSTLHGAGDGSTTVNLPDSRGRTRVCIGTHTDVNTVGKNDGVAVGFRRAKHRHTFAPPAISSHTHPFGREVVGLTSGATQYAIIGNQSSHDVATDAATPVATGGTVGADPTNDVLDAPAWIVKSVWTRVA